MAEPIVIKKGDTICTLLNLSATGASLVLGPQYRLSFLDPPFNIGHGYEGYDDKQPREVYENRIFSAIEHTAARTEGVICCHGNDDLVELYLQAGRLLGLKRHAWVNWHYRFGVNSWHNWVDSRCHCIIYLSKGLEKPPVWNPEAVAVPSDRAAVYNDKRVDQTERGGMRPPFTIWGLPEDGPNWGRVQGQNKERVPERPNQLPENYLARLIKAYTNPGDLVFDPFCGTGTTAVVAMALGCNVVTSDLDPHAVEHAAARIERGAARKHARST